MTAVRVCYTRKYDPQNYNDGRILPSELWEHIFRYLDARTFCKSRQVCRSWNEIIKPMLFKKNVWRTFCINEIPENVLEELLYYKNYRKVFDLDWMNIYRKWFSSKMIVHSDHWEKKFNAFYENPVTTVKISGSWIITGHANGRLSTWKLATGELNQSFMCHLMIIVDMALVDILNLGSYFGDDQLPWDHHHIITISRDSYINISSLLEPMAITDYDFTICSNPDKLNQIRVFDDLFAVSTRENTVTLWRMELQMEPDFRLKAILLLKIAGPIDYLMCLGLWHSQVRCISHGCKIRQFQREVGEWTSESQIPIVYRTARPISSFLCRKNISLLLTGDGKINISIGDAPSTQCYLREKLGTDITSSAFHGTILALGGENGKLFLYHIPNEDHLIHKDYTSPDCVISLSEVSIITLDISFQYNTPVVVACSTDNIYVVKWYTIKEEQPLLSSSDILQHIVQHL